MYSFRSWTQETYSSIIKGRFNDWQCEDYRRESNEPSLVRPYCGWWFHARSQRCCFFLNDTTWYSSFLYIKKKKKKAWIKRSPGSSPDIWLSSWVSGVNWTPFLSYEIVMLKHKSYPDRNLNCSKIGTIRMSFIWFIIIVKCWTKDKILCFSRKSFVPLHKINMRSLICIQVFLDTNFSWKYCWNNLNAAFSA